MSFTIENARIVLDLNTNTATDLPQEVMITDLKKSIAKTTGIIHPLSIGQFVKGLSDIGAIEVHGSVVKMTMYASEL